MNVFCFVTFRVTPSCFAPARLAAKAYGIAHCRGVARVGTKSVLAVGANRPAPCSPITADGPLQAEWIYTHIEEGSAGDVVTKETKVDAESQLSVCEELIKRCHDTEEFNHRIRLAICYPVYKPTETLPDGVHEDEIVAAAVASRSLANKYDGVGFTQVRICAYN